MGVAAVIWLLWPTFAPVQAASIVTSKHNLSSTGPGTIKAAPGEESGICIFCHVPHNSDTTGPLWNRDQPASPYTPYTSSTRKIASPGQPTGASLLCLSCHDGTIALGKIKSRATAINTVGRTNFLAGDTGYLGTDLSDDHPVSFLYSSVLSNPELRSPYGSVKLDASGQMQCTACHSPHDDANGKFLVVNNIRSALCVTCHNKSYWAGSDHATSTKTWNNSGTNPWPHTSYSPQDLANNACESCHRPHTAPRHSRLLNQSVEEQNCLVCHNGNVAAKNIQTELNKTYHHGVASYSSGQHDAAEPNLVGTVHVQCVDCHNPHSANTTVLPTKGGSAVPPLPGSLSNMRGIDINGTAKYPVTAEYEICFRCHADSTSKPVSSSVPRLIAQNNVRLEFQPTNPSYHPIAAPGRSSSVPSLLAPWTTSSRMDCTDCHNNDTGPYSTGTGTTPSGSGVNGPHGSTNPTLLERRYDAVEPVRESAAAYALCYKCHDRNKIFSTSTSGSFTFHYYHLNPSDGVNASCNTCHDPHGISGTQGSVLNNSRLMNFNSAIVSASPGNGPARWERVGTIGGRCYLVCHGKNHNPLTYSGGPP